jgi:hypothetical protein
MEQAEELASPGPARTVEVQLSSGHRAVIVFHERYEFVELVAPIEPGVEAGLADLLAEIGVEPEAITWTHEHLDRGAISTLHSSTASGM